MLDAIPNVGWGKVSLRVGLWGGSRSRSSLRDFISSIIFFISLWAHVACRWMNCDTVYGDFFFLI